MEVFFFKKCKNIYIINTMKWHEDYKLLLFLRTTILQQFTLFYWGFPILSMVNPTCWKHLKILKKNFFLNIPIGRQDSEIPSGAKIKVNIELNTKTNFCQGHLPKLMKVKALPMKTCRHRTSFQPTINFQ